MKHSSIALFLAATVFLCCARDMHARVVGSNTASARQVATFFPAVDTDNKMLGFSVFEKGMMLESKVTSCVWDAFFPLSGNIVLNGGTLTLARDMSFSSPYSLGTGQVNGEGWNSFLFPGSITEFAISLPSVNCNKQLSLLADISVGAAVNAVDWSFDSQYVAVARQGAAGNELQVYYVHDYVVTLTAGLDLGTINVNTVRWHPSAYYLALGTSSGNTLMTYYFNSANGTLQLKSSVATSVVNAVAWGPTGDSLAVGMAITTNMVVYKVINGVLGSSYQASFGRSSTVQKNALGWDSSGTYLAAGLATSTQNTELKIFQFTGSSLVLNTELELGVTVYALAWHPTQPYLAVGLTSGSESLKLYSFVPGALSYIAASAGIVNRVYGLHWHKDGAFLAAATQTSSLAYDLTIFTFDSNLLLLNVAAGYRTGSDIYAAAWSNDGTKICFGDAANRFKVLNYALAPLIFNNMNLFWNSSGVITAPIIFQGACVMDGGGRDISFDEFGSMIIAANSSLLVKNVVMQGITAHRIWCADDSSEIILKNMEWNQDGVYTFSVGSLRFKSNIIMSGDATFVYNAKQTSTVESQSSLVLNVGFTFSYDPGVASKNLLLLSDSSAQLVLDGGTLHTTTTGMQLTHGTIQVWRESFLSADSNVQEQDSEGFTFGSNMVSSDVYLDIYSGSVLTLKRGVLNYRNSGSLALNLPSVSSVLNIASGASLKLYQSMNLGSGILTFGDGATLARVAGKRVIGSTHPQGKLIFMDLPSGT